MLISLITSILGFTVLPCLVKYINHCIVITKQMPIEKLYFFNVFMFIFSAACFMELTVCLIDIIQAEYLFFGKYYDKIHQLDMNEILKNINYYTKIQKQLEEIPTLKKDPIWNVDDFIQKLTKYNKFLNKLEDPFIHFFYHAPLDNSHLTPEEIVELQEHIVKRGIDEEITKQEVQNNYKQIKRSILTFSAFTFITVAIFYGFKF